MVGNSKHIPLLCTDVEEHKHLTNHFNKQLNVKIFDIFTDHFSNVNVDSIQETYLKISVYNKVIGQYVEQTNLKYSFSLKFTKLEAPEVGLWEKIFQVAGHNEDQQLPEEQWSEQPIPQAHQPHQQEIQQITQQPALPTSELQIAEQ